MFTRKEKLKRWFSDHYEVSFAVVFLLVAFPTLVAVSFAVGAYQNASFNSVLIGLHGSLAQFAILTVMVGYLVLRRKRGSSAELRDHAMGMILEYGDLIVSQLASNDNGPIVFYGKSFAYLRHDPRGRHVTSGQLRYRYRSVENRNQDEYRALVERTVSDLKELDAAGDRLQAVVIPLASTILNSKCVYELMFIRRLIKSTISHAEHTPFERRSGLPLDLWYLAERSRGFTEFVIKKADRVLSREEHDKEMETLRSAIEARRARVDA